MHQDSLNMAWPLVQGVSGGTLKATHCANPGCRIALKSENPLIPEWLVTPKLIAPDGSFSGRLCYGCLRYATENNEFRTHEGLANGHLFHKFKIELINTH
jgi:hypothetical protein